MFKYNFPNCNAFLYEHILTLFAQPTIGISLSMQVLKSCARCHFSCQCEKNPVILCFRPGKCLSKTVVLAGPFACERGACLGKFVKHRWIFWTAGKTLACYAPSLQCEVKTVAKSFLSDSRFQSIVAVSFSKNLRAYGLTSCYHMPRKGKCYIAWMNVYFENYNFFQFSEYELFWSFDKGCHAIQGLIAGPLFLCELTPVTSCAKWSKYWSAMCRARWRREILSHSMLQHM